MSQTNKNQTPPFWESKRNRIIMWSILCAACVITLILELFIHPEHHFDFVEFPMASAVLGFIACSLMILGAKGLGIVLKQKENYYDNDEIF